MLIAESFIETNNYEEFYENVRQAFEFSDNECKRGIVKHLKKYPQYKNEKKDTEFVKFIDVLEKKLNAESLTVRRSEKNVEANQNEMALLEAYIKDKRYTFTYIAKNRNIIDFVQNFGVRRIDESNYPIEMKEQATVYFPEEKNKEADETIIKTVWFEYIEGKYNTKIREAYIVLKLDNLDVNEFTRLTDLLNAITKGNESPFFFITSMLKWTSIIKYGVSEFEKLTNALSLLKSNYLVYEKRLFIWLLCKVSWVK